MRHALEKLPVCGIAWKQQSGHGCLACLDPDSFRLPFISRVVLDENQIPILWPLRVFHALVMGEVERELIKVRLIIRIRKTKMQSPWTIHLQVKEQSQCLRDSTDKGNLGPDAPSPSALAFCKLHSEFRFTSSRISEHAEIASCTPQHMYSSRK